MQKNNGIIKRMKINRRNSGNEESVEKEYPTFLLSEDAVRFIARYAVPTLEIDGPITEDVAEKIFDFASECELNMIDSSGKDRTDDYPEKERDILGDEYVSEVSGRWANNYVVDLIDLNLRLAHFDETI